jgi:hypothetical protein
MLLEPTAHIGGMLANGLDATDIGDKASLGGYAEEFFDRISAYYAARNVSTRWAYQAHVTEQIFGQMLSEAGVSVVLNSPLRETGGVVKAGAALQSITTVTGKSYSARTFIDASYEGDLMAQAGVSHRVGRESQAEYGESLAGVLAVKPVTTINEDPPDVVSTTPPGPLGSADGAIQAANYRMCWSSNAATRVPFSAPADYDRTRFLMVTDYLNNLASIYGTPAQLSWVMSLYPLPLSEYDVNDHGAISSALPSMNYGWPDGTYAERAAIEAQHRAWDQGLTWFLFQDPAVPQSIRHAMSAYSWCSTEWADNGHFPRELYIREGRRMVGAYVMTQADVAPNKQQPDAIGIGSYRLDAHYADRWAVGRSIYAEGYIYEAYRNYEIPYRALTPKASEASNLLVTVDVAATHVAWSTVRMEPHLMIMGEAGGLAAAMAALHATSVQDVDTGALQAGLRSQGAIVNLVVEGTPGPPAVSVSVAGSAMIVSWKAPADDGLSPIIDYSVTSSPGTVTCTTSGLSCSIDGLARNRTYTFTVRARNSLGWGTPAVSARILLGSPSTYHPISPVRLLDTRHGTGHSGKLTAGAPVTFVVAGRGGIAVGATAVTGNLTVVNATGRWAVYVGPDPVANPGSSTINFATGQITSNGLTVALSATGTLSATYLGPSRATTDLVFDVAGFYTPDATGQTYHPIDPVRELDTRVGEGLATRIRANTPACFTVAGRSTVPAEATSVTGNVTVVEPSAAWALDLGPVANSSPSTSTLNFVAGQVASNNVTMALGAHGELCATYMGPAGATADLVFDVTGYFTADASGYFFVPVSPARVLDTRSGNGLTGRFTASSPRTLTVSGRGGIPKTAVAITGNLTVVDETGPWAIFLGPQPTASPTTSAINFVRGDVKANGVTVALPATGTLSATYMGPPGASTSLVLDVTGYFVK